MTAQLIIVVPNSAKKEPMATRCPKEQMIKVHLGQGVRVCMATARAAVGVYNLPIVNVSLP